MSRPSTEVPLTPLPREDKISVPQSSVTKPAVPVVSICTSLTVIKQNSDQMSTLYAIRMKAVFFFRWNYLIGDVMIFCNKFWWTKTAIRERSVGLIWNMIKEERHTTVRSIQGTLKFGLKAINFILHRRLKDRKLYSQWILRQHDFNSKIKTFGMMETYTRWVRS